MKDLCVSIFRVFGFSLFLAIIFCSDACSTHKKLALLEESATTATVNLSDDEPKTPALSARPVTRDTLKIKDEYGNEQLLMKAVKDESTGEMVATEVLDAAVVTARFRNVSEYNGKIDLAFQVIVPASMQDERWQVRFYPDMFIMGDTLHLEPIVITGEDYRRAQLRGYQQYNRFLSRIVRDSSEFVNLRMLEIFLQRNMPDLYALKTDSTYLDDNDYIERYGVSEDQAIDHYTNKIAKRLNNTRKSRTGEMYRRYVKAPIDSSGIRIDSVVTMSGSDFVYNYVQTIETRPRLRKVDVAVSGDIIDEGEVIYKAPQSKPITFYISSISAFADNSEHYITKIVERHAEANTKCHVDFMPGKSTVDLRLGDNLLEIGRVKENMASLMKNEVFDLDSIVVDASASPEGRYAMNLALSHNRSRAISNYLHSYIRDFQDSLAAEQGVMIDEFGNVSTAKKHDVPFISHSSGENWKMLDYLVVLDTVMTEEEKSAYSELSEISDYDARETRMRQKPFYKYMSSVLYPKLRTVQFNFFLHRKDMVKDTVHTTVLDTVYMAGVKALKDMDYNLAISLLQPYNDFNTAVTYLALGRTRNALYILEPMEHTPEINYLLAVAYSRLGDDQKAVQCYMDACRENPSYVHRGNLDPEISILIKAYGLNRQDDDYEF